MFSISGMVYSLHRHELLRQCSQYWKSFPEQEDAEILIVVFTERTDAWGAMKLLQEHSNLDEQEVVQYYFQHGTFAFKLSDPTVLQQLFKELGCETRIE